MKFTHFRQIVSQIRSDIRCPHCRGIFSEGGIEVCQANLKHIDFHASCRECGTQVMISAQIRPLVRMPVRQHSSITNRILSPDSVRQIASGIKGFSGRDVRELFNTK
ncbi:hypothetical protein K9M41_01135 [Candidatus Gracilibacteria bacterium]|nr:hypothetical protein [Candidatus Gracilibacteria bacterium]